MPRLALLAQPAVRSAVSLEIGRAIEYHALIDSTQDRARELAGRGGFDGIVVADEQRAGQGTHGRTWHAARGMSLLASWVLRPAPAAPALVAALSGVAIARALAGLGVEGASLEWPNDVQLEGRKVAGVLAHGTSDGGGGVLVLGIGVNVHQRPDDFPFELRDTATSLAVAGHDIDRLALLARLCGELHRLGEAGAWPAALAEWRERSTLLGRGVRVTLPKGAVVEGTATAIDDEGALLVHTPSGVERIVSGEVEPS